MQYVKSKEFVTVKFYRFSATRRRARARSGWPAPRGQVVKTFFFYIGGNAFTRERVFTFECCVFFFFRGKKAGTRYLASACHKI